MQYIVIFSSKITLFRCITIFMFFNTHYKSIFLLKNIGEYIIIIVVTNKPTKPPRFGLL